MGVALRPDGWFFMQMRFLFLALFVVSFLLLVIAGSL